MKKLIKHTLTVLRFIGYCILGSLVLLLIGYFIGGCTNDSNKYHVESVYHRYGNVCLYKLSPTKGIVHRGSTINLEDDCGKYSAGDTLTFILKK